MTNTVPSTLLANTALPGGSGGGYKATWSFWTATKLGSPREEITPLILDGTIEMSLSRAPQRTARFMVKDTTQIDALQDFIQAILTFRGHDGQPETTHTMGTFRVTQPETNHTPRRAPGTLDCEDVTVLLQEAIFADDYTVALGTNYGTAIKAILALVGLTVVQLPATTRTLARAKTFKVGTSLLDAANTLCRAIHWYNLYAAGDGTIMTMPSRKIASVSPVLTVTPDTVYKPIVERPDASRVCNVVVVVRDDPSLPQLESVARNDDPTSKTSTVGPENGGLGLGYERARFIQEPSLDSQADADALAAQYLEEGGSWYVAYKLGVLPTPLIDVHQTVDLVYDEAKANLSGRYWLQGWRAPIKPGLLDIDVNRVVDFG